MLQIVEVSHYKHANNSDIEAWNGFKGKLDWKNDM